jgi:hypothetical protein
MESHRRKPRSRGTRTKSRRLPKNLPWSFPNPTKTMPTKETGLTSGKTAINLGNASESNDDSGEERVRDFRVPKAMIRSSTSKPRNSNRRMKLSIIVRADYIFPQFCWRDVLPMSRDLAYIVACCPINTICMQHPPSNSTMNLSALEVYLVGTPFRIHLKRLPRGNCYSP